MFQYNPFAKQLGNVHSADIFTTDTPHRTAVESERALSNCH